MLTEFLSKWDMLAIQQGIDEMIKAGKLHSNHGPVLLDKLQKATHVRLSYPNENKPEYHTGHDQS